MITILKRVEVTFTSPSQDRGPRTVFPLINFTKDTQVIGWVIGTLKKLINDRVFISVYCPLLTWSIVFKSITHKKTVTATDIFRLVPKEGVVCKDEVVRAELVVYL